MFRLKNKYCLIFLGLLFFIIAIIRIVFYDLDHSDEFTDANILNAGENFIKFGFINCHFLPLHEPGLDAPQNLYTHYPPLADILNGLLRLIFRTNSLRFFRFVSLCFSFLGLLAWYFFIQNLTKSSLIGFLSSLFYLFNPLFIYGVDSLGISYTEFLRALIFLLFLKVLNTANLKRIIFFVFLWLAIVLETLFTFEYIIYLSLFFLLFKTLYPKEPDKKISLKEIFILWLAPIVGFMLHFLQNVFYFGSFLLALQDLKGAALQSVTQRPDATPLNFPLWVQNVLLRNISLVAIFNYFLIFLCIFFVSLFYKVLTLQTQKIIRRLFRLGLIFLICGLSWYIIFPAHSWAHTFVLFLARHLIPAVAIGFSIFIYIIFSFINEKIGSLGYLKVLWLIVIFIIFNGIIRSELPVTPTKIKQAQEFIKFKKCLLKLKEISQEKDVVAVNYYRFPFMRYYTGRRFINIFDRASLEKLSVLPKYFILIPYDNPSTQELFQFLNQRYSTIFGCNSERFPTIFFELKQ